MSFSALHFVVSYLPCHTLVKSLGILTINTFILNTALYAQHNEILAGNLKVQGDQLIEGQMELDLVIRAHHSNQKLVRVF